MTRPRRPTLDGFATRGELEAWTAEHRVGFELAVAADVLAPELAHAHPNAWGLRRELCLLSLRDIGSIDGARRVFGGAHLQELAVAAVRKRLDERAAEVRAGLAEERDRDRRVNGAPSTPSLAATLHELRAQQRRSAPPRSRAARAAGRWRFGKSELAIEWNEPSQLRGPTYATVPVIARLGFEPEPRARVLVRRAGMHARDRADRRDARPARRGRRRRARRGRRADATAVAARAGRARGGSARLRVRRRDRGVVGDRARAARAHRDAVVKRQLKSGKLRRARG